MYVIRKMFDSDVYYLSALVYDNTLIPAWVVEPTKAKVFQKRSNAEKINDALNRRFVEIKSEVIPYHEIVFWN